MNYLIFRNDGIGDLIVSTPLMQAIKDYDNDYKIYLVTSERNYDFAKIYLKDFIGNIILINSKPTFLELLKLFKYLVGIRFDYTIVLKPKYYNYWISFFLFPKIKLGVQIKSDYKRKIKFRPTILLSNILLNNFEIIDYSNNYKNEINIHHYEYYLNIFKKYIFKSKIDLDEYKYFIPQIDNKKYSISCFLNKLQMKITIIHVDEKWNRIEWADHNLTDLIIDIINRVSGIAVITEGISPTKLNKNLKKELFLQETLIKKLKNSKKNKNIFYINSPSIGEVISLISISNLVIEPHGSLTHISSIFNKNIIDLTYPGYANYLRKWRPLSIKSRQIEIKDYKNTRKKIIKTIDEFSDQNQI